MSVLKTMRARVGVARQIVNSLRKPGTGRHNAGRFIVADSAILGNFGHHANACRYLIQEAQNRGIQTRVYAHKDVIPELQADLRAVPHFRIHTYSRGDTDPICGWLKGFHLMSEVAQQDLAALSDIRREDIVLIHGAQPAQLMGAIQWALRIPEDQCPFVIVELGTDPGVSLVKNKSGSNSIAVPNPIADGRAMLFRFAAQWLKKLNGKPFHVVTYDPTISAIYARLMGEPIGMLPFPTPAITKPRMRSKASGPVTIATLGHQQISKGYTLMPEIAAKLLKLEPDIRLLIHNSDSQQKFVGTMAISLREAHEKLRSMAAADSRLVFDERSVEFDDWVKLLEGTDLMLCPYDPRRYATGHSGVASAAIANGIPLVVPAETSLSRWLEDFDRCGAAFDKFEPSAVVAAARKVLKDFDAYAARASAAAEKWKKTQGPTNFIDEVLRLNDWRLGGCAAPMAYAVAQEPQLEIEAQT
jgi:hypothetical protein